MTEDSWKPYYDYGQQRLFASNWHELFDGDPTDNRNKLTWKDLFAKQSLLNAAYNFYSPSDQIVENARESEQFLDEMFDEVVFGGGRHTWAKQEIGKGGTMLQPGSSSTIQTQVGTSIPAL